MTTVDVLDDGRMLHLPGQDGYTLCGATADTMDARQHNPDHAATWCRSCCLDAADLTSNEDAKA